MYILFVFHNMYGLSALSLSYPGYGTASIYRTRIRTTLNKHFDFHFHGTATAKGRVHVHMVPARVG